MMKHVVLNNNLSMPLVGLGTWKSKPGEVRTAVLNAIKAGYRHIDAAWIYQNQDEVGDGIADAIAEGIVTRADLWVTTKLWNSFHKTDQVEPHLRDSLAQLKLDYVDLYLVHWPVTDVEAEMLTPSTQETWAGMEGVLKLGLTKTIGVSNFSVSKLTAMKEYTNVFPAVNQVELHPLCTQAELVAACKGMGVALTGYSPLGSPDSAVMFNKEPVNALNHPVVAQIASELGRSTGQVLIRWGMQRGTSVVPKSVTASRIIDNFDVFTFELTDGHMEQLSSIHGVGGETRACDGSFWCKPNGPYRTMDDLWA